MMSDNEIRKILIEEKKKERRVQALRDYAEGIIAFTSMMAICFMLAVIGG
jgi:hypothetical protein